MEGRLLDPVLLDDQNGQPVDNLCPEPDHHGDEHARRLTSSVGVVLHSVR